MGMHNEQASQPVEFDEFVRNAQTIFDEVISGKQITVERGNQLVRLSRVRRARNRTQRRFTTDDPLWDIVGIGQSNGSTDVSSAKHTYLADAAADLHQPD